MDALLEQLVSTSASTSTEAAESARLELLLADFLACADAGRSRYDAGPFMQDGVAGIAALLALRSSAIDLDDVDWYSLHHPGSVVWPVALALAMHSDSSGNLLSQAARAGYTTAATIADHLGTTHRATWHVTATAGALGAASAASVMLELSDTNHLRALKLAAANVGGLALAARERRGAASFNRAAATTLGLMAARAASVGAEAVFAPIDGLGGLVQAMSGVGSKGEPRVRRGVLDASVRLYPVSGFLQSVVAATSTLRTRVSGDVRSIRIGVPEGIRSLVDGEVGGPWWDARLSALRAWAGADPFLADTPCNLDAFVQIVELYSTDLPAGYSNVTVTTETGEGSIEVSSPPMLSEPSTQIALNRKWSTILNFTEPSIMDFAQVALSSKIFGAELREVLLP